MMSFYPNPIFHWIWIESDYPGDGDTSSISIDELLLFELGIKFFETQVSLDISFE